LLQAAGALPKARQRVTRDFKAYTVAPEIDCAGPL
jgi:hypothetical protein